MQTSEKGDLNRFVKSIIEELGPAASGLIALIALYSLFEGVALSLLLPLLQQLGVGAGTDQAPWTTAIEEAMRGIGLTPGLGSMLLVMGGLFAVQQLLFLAHRRLAAHLQAKYTLNWRTRLFRQVFAADWIYFTRTRASDVANAIMRECERINLAFYNVVELAASSLLAFIYVVLAVAISWQGAIFLAVLGATVYLLTRPILRKSVKAGHEITSSNEAMTKAVHEYLAGAKLVKATGTEVQAGDDFARHARRSAKFVETMGFQPAQLRASFELSGMLGLLAMIGIGVTVLRINPGEILVTAYLFLRLHSRVSMIQQALNNLNFYLAGFRTASQIHRDALAREEPLDGQVSTEPNKAPAIAVESVSVVYGETEVLRNASIRVQAGEVVAFVGRSGAGKSTLVDTILGLVRPTKGQVRIDGVVLSSMAPQAWRRRVGYVGQDTFLFNASVTDNIRWSVPDASTEQVREAARKAHADEFITRMDGGYEATVGDSGVRLSGGQRQRIGLARALLGERKLLILDEATSALDYQSELAVMEAIKGLRGEMTVLMIAHRLSTVREADRIVVLEQGRVFEVGTWAELMARESRLRAMWVMQQGEENAIAVEASTGLEVPAKP